MCALRDHVEPQVFNNWWYNHMYSDAMKKLFRKERTGREKPRGWVRKAGLMPSDRRPLLEQSIADFGGLHYGSEYGWHKIRKPIKRGRPWEGERPNVLICIELGKEVDRRDKSGKLIFGRDVFNNFSEAICMGVAYAIFQEAKKVNAVFSMAVGMRDWEKVWNELYPDASFEGIPTPTLPINVFDRAGLPVVVEQEFDVGNHYIDGYADFTSSKFEGAFPTNRIDYKFGDGIGALSPIVFRRESDYAKVEDFFMKFPTKHIRHTVVSDCNEMMSYVASTWKDFSPHKKGTIIIIQKVFADAQALIQWKSLDKLAEVANIFFFDIGDKDRSTYFYGGMFLSGTERDEYYSQTGENDPFNPNKTFDDAVDDYMRTRGENMCPFRVRPNDRYSMTSKKGLTDIAMDDGYDYYNDHWIPIEPLATRGGKKIIHYIHINDINNLAEIVLREVGAI